MRAVSLVVTASIFSSIFVGMALTSAVITGTVHAQLSAKSIAVELGRN